MTTTRLLKYDPEMGTATYWHYDDSTDLVTIETRQDVTDLIEGNKAEYASIDEHAPWHDGQGDRVASIPLNTYFDLRAKGIVDDDDPKRERFRQWLNNSDNRFFRTRPGTI